jgi:hypothetical protein
LFSEPGLALSWPVEDILFLEDFVYAAGLLEEYSIAAYYSEDAQRKIRGRAACNFLALGREVPDATRNLARSNLFFYAESASALMPSFTAHSVEFTAPDGYRPMNPSITRVGDRLMMCQRCVNWILIGERYLTPLNEDVQTRNFLIEISDDFRTQSSAEILPPIDLPPPAFPTNIGRHSATTLICMQRGRGDEREHLIAPGFVGVCKPPQPIVTKALALQSDTRIGRLAPGPIDRRDILRAGGEHDKAVANCS